MSDRTTSSSNDSVRSFERERPDPASLKAQPGPVCAGLSDVLEEIGRRRSSPSALDCSWRVPRPAGTIQRRRGVRSTTESGPGASRAGRAGPSAASFRETAVLLRELLRAGLRRPAHARPHRIAAGAISKLATGLVHGPVDLDAIRGPLVAPAVPRDVMEVLEVAEREEAEWFVKGEFGDNARIAWAWLP